MYDLEGDDEIPTFDSHETSAVTDHKWRAWAAKETQLRALLGHYVLDGQISDYTGGPACQRHTSHSLPIPTDDFIFEAVDSSQWREKIASRRARSSHFSSLFSSIFSENVHIRHLGTSLSSLSASVLLEGLKSLVAERIKPGTTVVGIPSHRDISRGLGRLNKFILQSTSMSEVSKQVALLRWHTICLDAAVNFSWLCRNLCCKFNVEQRIIGGRDTPSLDLDSWVHTPQARLGLLHATNMFRILQALPVMQTQMFHVPEAVFSAGIVFCGFLLGGITTIAVPDAADWDSVILMDLDTPLDTVINELDSEVWCYLNSSFNGPVKSQNILYDLNVFSRSLKSLEQPWGVSIYMHHVLEQLSSRCG